MTTRSNVRALPRPAVMAARNDGESATSPLFERDEELARLTGLFTACTSGAGAVAVVSGAVGVGKTALLRALAERVTGSGGVALGATGVLAERSVPLGVISELFRSLELVDGRRAERVARLLGEGAFDAAEPGLPAAEPVRRRVMHELWAVLRELAATAPLLLAVDDVHYADAASLQCLLYVVHRLWSCPILMVLAESEHARRDNPLFRTELLREPRCERIYLGRLSARGVEQLAGGRLEPAAVAELAAFSGGNPLLVRALIADQQPASPDPRGRSRTGLVVGDAFAQAVMSCVHRVEPTMVAAVRGLALLGEATSSAMLGRLLDVDAGSAARAIRGLQDAGLLAAGWFRHPAAAAAVLDSLSGRDRRDGHRRIAQLLHDEGGAATVIARHLVAAGHDGEDWVLPVLLEAAEQARRDDDVDFAVECLELALPACSDEARRAAVTMRLARVQWRANPAIAARHLASLTGALLTGQLPAGDAPMLVRALLWHGRAGEAAEVLAYTGAIQDGSCPEATARLLATDEWRLLAPALHEQPAAAATQEAFSRPAVLADALTRGSDGGSVDGAVDGVTAGAERFLRAARLDDDSIDSIEAALLALVYADRSDRAALLCAPLLEQASGRRAATWQARLAAVQAEIAFRQGDAPAAERWARAALTHIPRRSWGVVIGAPLASLVLALLAVGRTDEAAEQLNQPVPPAMARTRYGTLYQHARGRHHLAAGRPHAALADFLACGEQLSTWGIDLPSLVPWRGDAAVVCLRLGERERARRLAEEQLARSGSARSRSHAMALRVLAATSEVKHRPRLLWQAAEALRAVGDRLELARTLVDMSRAHDALGEPGRSRALAQQALQLAEACQAEPLVRAVLGRYTAPELSGAEPTGRGGTAVLSDAERRVASLVALGHTNREVAQELFLTVSTVEQHLTRIYRKLNVSGRSDLSVCLELDIAEPV